eukprot:5979025-Alexandrium_andersonii.AAC.2
MAEEVVRQHHRNRSMPFRTVCPRNPQMEQRRRPKKLAHAPVQIALNVLRMSATSAGRCKQPDLRVLQSVLARVGRLRADRSARTGLARARQ